MRDILKDLKVTVTHISGTSREVADRARTTIGLGEGDKPISDNYMRKMYLCEHSPIRTQIYKIKLENLPTWVSTHFVRHKIGVEHFVSTQRTDRTNIDRNSKSQDSPVTHEMVLNPQAFITISRKRCCNCASLETRKVWNMVLDELEKINAPLRRACVPDCVYRGWCYEHKSCNYHKTRVFRIQLNEYRDNINGYGGNINE